VGGGPALPVANLLPPFPSAWEHGERGVPLLNLVPQS
jgi:hypothetical protein